jgi:hypothetical protein
MIFRTFAFGVILEASVERLKNLARWGNQVIKPLSSRCFGFPLKPPA